MDGQTDGTQVVEGQSDVTPDTDLESAGQGVVDAGQAGEAGSEAGQTGEQQTVPKERFDAVNNQVKSLTERLALVEQNNALAAANAPAAGAAAAEQFDILKQVGVLDDPDGIVTVGQQRKIREYDQKVHTAEMADLRFAVEHPDFKELVGTNEQIQTGQFAAPLASAIKENPALLPSILGSRNPRLAAYNIAKSIQSKPAPAKPEPDPADIVNEAVTNAAKVKSSSNVKGGGALSAEGRYMSMTDEAFLDLQRQHGGML